MLGAIVGDIVGSVYEYGIPQEIADRASATSPRNFLRFIIVGVRPSKDM